MSNPNVSEEAKLHSQSEIERIEAELGTSTTSSGLDSHVIGGYKAALNSTYLIFRLIKLVVCSSTVVIVLDPNVSDEAKANAQRVLSDAGVDTYGATGAPVANTEIIEEDLRTGDEHQNRVLGGYKATLNSTSSLQLFLIGTLN